MLVFLVSILFKYVNFKFLRDYFWRFCDDINIFFVRSIFLFLECLDLNIEMYR